jgi:RimJ/RimL family protein N-acetyltransferase
VRYVEDGEPLSLPQIEAGHQRRVANASLAPGLGHWAGFIQGDVFVGRFALASTKADHNVEQASQGELGYRLLPAFWRQGLAREGATELVRHGFEDLGLSRISAQTMAINQASRSVMEAVGLRYVRTFHVSFENPIPGTEEGEVEYATTRDEWSGVDSAVT